MFLRPFLTGTFLSLLLTGTAMAVGQPETQAAKAESQAAKFEALHGETGASVKTAPRVPLKAVLEAFGQMARSYDNQGYGDLEYWLRSYEDWVRGGRALGKALTRIGNATAAGPVRVLITTTGSQLSQVGGQGYGDVDYWIARSNSVVTQIRGAGDQLIAVGGSLPPSDTVELSVVLEAVADATDGVSSGGYGDLEYWIRAAQIMRIIGQGVGVGLTRIVSETQSPLSAILGSVAKQYASLSSGGYGDVDYWSARTRGLNDQLANLASLLRDTARSL